MCRYCKYLFTQNVSQIHVHKTIFFQVKMGMFDWSQNYIDTVKHGFVLYVYTNMFSLTHLVSYWKFKLSLGQLSVFNGILFKGFNIKKMVLKMKPWQNDNSIQCTWEWNHLFLMKDSKYAFICIVSISFFTETVVYLVQI